MNSPRRPLGDRAARWLSDPARALWCLVLLFLVAAALATPVDRKGDASEYILTTESLYFDHDLVVANKVDIFRHLLLRPQRMDTPAGLTRMPGTDGVERFGLHSFYYPLAVVPFYALFGYAGFHVLNALALWVMLLVLQRWLSRQGPPLLALGFSVAAVFFSAAWAYVFWAHPEVFYTTLVTLFLYGWLGDRPWVAAVAGGIVFAAQPPLAVLGVLWSADLVRRRQYRWIVRTWPVMILLAAPQLVYNVHWLGTLVPMTKAGLASAKYLSPSVLLAFLFDPAMGLVWFYPIVFYCLICARRGWRSTAMIGAAVIVLFALTAVRNVYSHQVGLRYANFVLPIFLFLLDRLHFKSWPERVALGGTVVLGAGLAINPLGNSAGMDIRQKTFLPYEIATTLPEYTDNPEVFRTSSMELVPDRVYVRDLTPRDHWTLGGGRSRLMLLDLSPGPLDLTVVTRAGGSHQFVQLSTPHGKPSGWLLESKQVATIHVDLAASDIRSYDRWDNRTYVYVDIEAEPWVPAIDQQGTAPEAHDLRRLGVQIQKITSKGVVLFDAAASK